MCPTLVIIIIVLMEVVRWWWWWWWSCHQHRQWGEVVVWSCGRVDNGGGRWVVVVALSTQAVGWSLSSMEVLG